MNKNMMMNFIALCVGLLIGLVVLQLTKHIIKPTFCPVAEVYMTGNIQEDDLFIPATSIGKVDLKR